MVNKKQKTLNIQRLQAKAQLIQNLTQKNLKGGGGLNCPPPIQDPS